MSNNIMDARHPHLGAQPSATPKQREFIERLVAERDTTGTIYEEWTPDWSRATKAAASIVIDFLLTLPKRATETVEGVDVQAGVYADAEGTLHRVYLGQQSGRMLVKRIEFSGPNPLDSDNVEYALWAPVKRPTSVEYTYVGAAAKVVTPEWRRLSVEEVGSLGKSWDHCLCCGRRLDDPESVDRGIGPICAAKYEDAA